MTMSLTDPPSSRRLLGRLRRRTITGLLAAAMLAATAPGLAVSSAAASSSLPYQDAELPVAERAADLLARMTLEEKVGQMTQTERLQVYDDETPITDLAARQHPVRRRFHADGEHPDGLG